MTERASMEAFSKGKEEITAKFNTLGTGDAS